MEIGLIVTVYVTSAIVSAILCAVVASEKNREVAPWVVAGFLFPLFTLIAVAGVPDKTTRRIRECPTCSEPIGIRASLCPFCRQELKPVVYCNFHDCKLTLYVEPDKAIYRTCHFEDCDKQHAFCSDYHATLWERDPKASGEPPKIKIET